jgi:hypothetical protein
VGDEAIACLQDYDRKIQPDAEGENEVQSRWREMETMIARLVITMMDNVHGRRVDQVVRIL